MIQPTKLIKSFGYALEGLAHAWKFDQNLRIHVLIAVIVLLLAYFLQVPFIEVIILSVLIILVITTEMINTAIENMVDLITSEHRQEAKIAKDVSSGMVFIAAVGSLVVGLLIFLPYIFKLITQ
ncbi:MAG: diacylglycerol kinase family protein [Candidatus Levybacteria bacterium]|nr:diacylglycerol kinase family protein [Candidatus Levybacteria bacterium]